MGQLKFTKTELRMQQHKLSQLERYLPTLQMKKALLQLEIAYVLSELEAAVKEAHNRYLHVQSYQKLLSSQDAFFLDQACQILQVKSHQENVAGVDITVLDKIEFYPAHYSLFDTSYWLESGIEGVRSLIIAEEKLFFLSEKKAVLEKELREISIRVNLFEKIMIPRSISHIKKIKIFLGDQQLAAVSQAKASKKKILERKRRAVAYDS